MSMFCGNYLMDGNQKSHFHRGIIVWLQEKLKGKRVNSSHRPYS